jgi:ADP-dependent phosphofructokinase/glucokinase
MESSNTLFILITLLLGGFGGVALSNWWRKKKDNPITDVRKESTILLDRIEKVFKVVMAEGYFTEILSYQDDKKFLYFINDPKKALIIAKAKVLVGFDFAKIRFRQPESGEKKLIIESFPEPQVLSIDTDYKFYDIDPGYLNHFRSEDYTRLLDESKQTMLDRAMESDLPRIANNQIQFMMYQLAETMGWQLELPESEQRKLTELTQQYDSLKAEPKALPGDILDEEN